MAGAGGDDRDGDDREVLFVGTAEAEHLEMYLKSIWYIRERGEEPRISTIARMLNVRQPSVVQMLKKLRAKGLVRYNRLGARLAPEGEAIGSAMIRNSRLLEVLMDSSLKMKIDEEMVCGIEHHMSRQFTDALCTMLGHPRRCPHDLAIPEGECCAAAGRAGGGAGGGEGAPGRAGPPGGGGPERRAPRGSRGSGPAPARAGRQIAASGPAKRSAGSGGGGGRFCPIRRGPAFSGPPAGRPAAKL